MPRPWRRPRPTTSAPWPTAATPTPSPWVGWLARGARSRSPTQPSVSDGAPDPPDVGAGRARSGVGPSPLSSPPPSTPPSPDAAFDLIREVDAGHPGHGLVVVGHNPTMAYLADLHRRRRGGRGRHDEPADPRAADLGARAVRPRRRVARPSDRAPVACARSAPGRRDRSRRRPRAGPRHRGPPARRGVRLGRGRGSAAAGGGALARRVRAAGRTAGGGGAARAGARLGGVPGAPARGRAGGLRAPTPRPSSWPVRRSRGCRSWRRTAGRRSSSRCAAGSRRSPRASRRPAPRCTPRT